jgi:biopolymer transport protein ExbD
MKSLRRSAAAVDASAMADIAFLLLVFFMVTTVIKDEAGLMLLLPPHMERLEPYPIADRNLYKVQINSADQLMVNGERRANLAGVKDEIKAFVLNKGEIETLSDNPTKAVVSLKADRGTSHAAFVRALDELQGAYYEIYAERAGISPAQYRELDLRNPDQRIMYNKGREGIPMNISIAEPTEVE